MKLSLLVSAALVALFAAPAIHAQTPVILFAVDNGDYFYDSNGDCIGDTNDPTGHVALRHWHVGEPFAGASSEPVGGFGCMDGGRPQTYTVTVPDGMTASVTGSIRYTWDTNVPGGGCNDVQIHIFDAGGNLVYTTLTAPGEGPRPVVPMVLQVRSHAVSTTLGPGTYAIQEDIFSGEHTAWLTKLTVSAW
ncbi:MAG: hypothetical protein ACYDCK_07090 [Thermoplasmatota archaeon]